MTATHSIKTSSCPAKLDTDIKPLAGPLVKSFVLHCLKCYYLYGANTNMVVFQEAPSMPIHLVYVNDISTHVQPFTESFIATFQAICKAQYYEWETWWHENYGMFVLRPPGLNALPVYKSTFLLDVSSVPPSL